MKRTNIIVVVLLSISIFVLISVLGLLLFLISRGMESERHEIKLYKYQSFQFNSHENRSSYGIITLSEKLGPEEYISLKVNDDEYLLVSNFGTGEYQCRGSCYCEHERRSSRSVLSKNILYFLSAVSSVVAYRKASEFYERECVDSYGDSFKRESFEEKECPEDSIRIEVDDCFSITSIYVDGHDKLQDGEEMYEFLCEGKCSLRQIIPDVFESWYEKTEDKKIVKMLGTRRNFCEKLDYVFTEFVGGVDDKSALNKALRSFALKLKDFCQVSSVMEGRYRPMFDRLGKKKPFSWCTYNPKMAVRLTSPWDEKRNGSPRPVPPYAKCRGAK